MQSARWTGAVVAFVVAAFAAALGAQPPGEFNGPPGRGPGPAQGGFRPPQDPIRGALDANHDHQLDADEIKNASAALQTLDSNGDGIVNHHEMRPPFPPGSPNRDGRGLDRGPPPGRGGPEGLGGGGPDGPAGGVPRRQGGRGGPRGGDGGDEAAGPRRPGPSPERFIERMMACDADGDGKLDRDELRACAEQMRRPRGGPGASPGAGPDGDRPEPPPPSE